MPKKTSSAGEVNHRLKTTPIAIVGMASIFPQAHNLDEYWDNILNKINCISDVPDSRWKTEDYYDPDPKTPDKTYCKKGGFIPDIDFDPMEFGLPPNILEVTDVSQLLSLVVAKEALEDAGYGEGREFDRDSAGVILGVVGMSSKLVQPLFSRLQYPVWEKVLRSAGVPAEDTQILIEKFKSAYVGWEENAFPGTIVNVIAGRICNRFDLGGTNCVIDAACGSSLAAVRMAVMELVEGRNDMMITGGVDVDNSILTYMCFSKTPAFSQGGECKSFDAEADGMMAGEGIGMVVLKRLADAERDGDRIYAVIRGIGSSSDGRFKSIYAPRPEGQAKALRRAYEDAGFSPATVGLVEAHGTGTKAGDPAEFAGMHLVFSENNPNRQTIALGSVKSQIGHTKSTAGTAALIKTTLALHNKVLPATINVSKPNPKLDIANTPFFLNTETRPWMRPAGAPPRRAGVSAFGFGGTNFHVVLEEYNADHQDAYRRNRVAQMILLDAPTQAMLVAKSQDTLAALKAENGEVAFYELDQAAQEREIPLNHARVGFVALTREEAASLLQTAMDLMKDKAQEEAWESPKGIFYRKSGVDPQGKVVALFPGQGAQYVEMGRELAVNFPTVRETFSQMDGLFLTSGETPLSNVVFPIPVFDAKEREAQNETLTKTQNAQPAIGTLSAAIYKILQQGGFQPDFTAGHSFGELTALWAGGVLSEKDFYALAKARGKAMAPLADPNFDAGTMLAVKGDVEKIRQEIAGMPDVTLANWNSKNQVVLAGPKAAMAQAQQTLTDKGFSAMPLSVSAAFHTPLVGHAQKPFAEVIAKTAFNAPAKRIFSNSTGKEHVSDPLAIRGILAEHVLNPVLWKDEIEAIYAAGGYFFVECGPKSILTNLVDNILADKPHVAVALNASAKKDSDRQLREAVVKLKVAGLRLGKIDPFQGRKVTAPKKRSAVTVKLNGGLFVSEKTRKAFDRALNDGYRLIKPQPAMAAAVAAPVAVKTVELPRPVPQAPVPAPVQPVLQAPAPAPVQTVVQVASPAVMNAVEQAMARLQTQQSETTHVHEQYLTNDAEYGRIFSQVTQMGVSLVSNPNANNQQIEQALSALQSIERSMMRFHDHQAETLKVHEQYLKGQEEFSGQYVQLVKAQFEALKGSPSPAGAFQPAPYTPPAAPAQTKPVQKPLEDVRKVTPVINVAPAPVAVEAPKNGNGNGHKAEVVAPAAPAVQKPVPAPVQATPTAASQDFAKALLGVVSEKTGYPPEMLDLSMDMEADLGIDSIKRVEIVGSLREIFPLLPKMEADTFGEIRSLGQIIDYMHQTLGQSPTSTAPAAASAAPALVVSTPAPVQAAPAAGLTGAAVAQALLAIVSEKTGYPPEMLDQDMDMEADLGIDSIKRVEILGAMREVYPDLPKVAPEDFAEMRSLRQVSEHITRVLPGVQAATSAPVAISAPAPVAQPVSEPAPVASPQAVPGGFDVDALAKGLLSVVSEKTGYPPEMLDLSMDMEADLGIDSIKKVEIMGAMRQIDPNLPKADPEAFAEARTLGQVVTYLGTLSGKTASGASADPF
jgi:polyketide-type polyunsaturated fatty acid synthase PfaA